MMCRASLVLLAALSFAAVAAAVEPLPAPSNTTAPANTTPTGNLTANNTLTGLSCWSNKFSSNRVEYISKVPGIILGGFTIGNRSEFEPSSNNTYVCYRGATCANGYDCMAMKGNHTLTPSAMTTWNYDKMIISLCEQYRTDGMHRDVICCSTNGCNRPDPKLDPNTTVAQALSGTSSYRPVLLAAMLVAAFVSLLV